MKIRNKIIIIFVGVLVGAVSGFFYWKFIGCENGCSIKSVWWRMSLWGGAMGGLLTSILLDFYIKYKTKNQIKKSE